MAAKNANDISNKDTIISGFLVGAALCSIAFGSYLMWKNRNIPKDVQDVSATILAVEKREPAAKPSARNQANTLPRYDCRYVVQYQHAQAKPVTDTFIRFDQADCQQRQTPITVFYSPSQNKIVAENISGAPGVSYVLTGIFLVGFMLWRRQRI